MNSKQSIRIVHISDTHGREGHENLIIPECDLLLHSGDVGGRTTPAELKNFLKWMSMQPAQEKIWVPGNHDICMDKNCWKNPPGSYISVGQLRRDYDEALDIIGDYDDMHMLINKECTYRGWKIYGNPYTPSFHRENGWAFNADRGEEIQKELARMPSDTDILITHGPPYGILDEIPEHFKATPEEDVHRGCHDMLAVIKKRMLQLKLVCFGHIHDQYGIVLKPISNTRQVLFSNGSVLNNNYKQAIIHPLIITL